MERTTLQKIAFCTLTAGVLAASQSLLAHTRLQTPSAVEGARVYNNAAIGHGCEPAVAGAPSGAVIANSLVFPDGTDSLVYKKTGLSAPADRELVPGPVDDYIHWGGQISHIPSKDVFPNKGVKWSRAGRAAKNPVGNQSWGGSLPGEGVVGLVPLRISGPFINETSCASSVTFRVAIADICKITKVAGFNEHTVNLWTPAVGSNFDGPTGTHAYNSPATYKITRDLVAHPLPDTCGGVGVDYEVDPSVAQLNSDLPIPGVWPK